jgi:hypothetical protein
MTFDDWCANHGVYLNDIDDAARAAMLMARHAWDAAMAENLPDAIRYRWLRDRNPADEGLWVAMGRPHTPAGISCWREESLDAAIDVAMRRAKRADGDA